MVIQSKTELNLIDAQHRRRRLEECTRQAENIQEKEVCRLEAEIYTAKERVRLLQGQDINTREKAVQLKTLLRELANLENSLKLVKGQRTLIDMEK